MRIWRALKAGGAGPLRDGAYLLPHSDDDRKVFEELAQEIKEGGGVAHILALDASSPEQEEGFRALFDRTAEYAQIAVRERGLVVGGFLATWRILRCNPLCRGGYDPVPHCAHCEDT